MNRREPVNKGHSKKGKGAGKISSKKKRGVYGGTIGGRFNTSRAEHLREISTKHWGLKASRILHCQPQKVEMDEEGRSRERTRKNEG